MAGIFVRGVLSQQVSVENGNRYQRVRMVFYVNMPMKAASHRVPFPYDAWLEDGTTVTQR
jgi:hypothetical protein